MKTFKDLVFKKPFSGLINGAFEFPNGFMVSVAAGSLVYCTPREDLDSEKDYSSFEVAVYNKEGQFVTKELTQSDSDVSGWCSREDINNIMELAAKQ